MTPTAARPRFSITTPIYYVNDTPHIGHAYTTIVADVLARYHRMLGEDVWFLTGTDEHGQKVQRSAEARGVSPQAHCDEYVARFRAAWERLGISHDRFVRTTEAQHVEVVRMLLRRVFERGDVYKSEYVGLYHVADETFVTKDDVKPEDIERGDVIEICESNYFFRLSNYREWLLEYIEANPRFVLPESRAAWVRAQLRQPIPDLCISRPKARLSWGIPLPFDEDYVCYVWFDALINYLTGLLDAGAAVREGETFEPRWPASVNLIGKDILLHHAIYWPIMLKALGLPLPETILAHGWWMSGERKIGKRDRHAHDAEALREAGAAFAAAGDRDARMRAACDVMMCAPTRPAAGPGAWLWLAEEFGVDELRYFLVRDMILGNDSQISLAQFATRVNAELANDLGNMLSRSAKLAATHLGGRLPATAREALGDAERALLEAGDRLVAEVRGDLAAFATHEVVDRVLAWVRELNGVFAALEPWSLAKAGRTDDLARVLRVTCDALAHAAALLVPVMPGKMAALLGSLGFSGDVDAIRIATLRVGELLPGEVHLGAVEALFPRIDVVAIAERELAAAGIGAGGGAGSGETGGGTKKAKTAAAAAPQKKKGENAGASKAGPATASATDREAGVALIGIDDFTKVDLRTAEVLEAARVEGTDKLLALRIRIGDEERPLVAGIAQHYAPEALVGRRIVVVANLKPATIRGRESRGMLLAAKTGGRLTLVTTDDPAFPSGASVG